MHAGQLCQFVRKLQCSAVQCSATEQPSRRVPGNLVQPTNGPEPFDQLSLILNGDEQEGQERSCSRHTRQVGRHVRHAAARVVKAAARRERMLMEKRLSACRLPVAGQRSSGSSVAVRGMACLANQHVVHSVSQVGEDRVLRHICRQAGRQEGRHTTLRRQAACISRCVPSRRAQLSTKRGGQRRQLRRTAHGVHCPLEGSPEGVQHVLPGGALPPCSGSASEAVGRRTNAAPPKPCSGTSHTTSSCCTPPPPHTHAHTQGYSGSSAGAQGAPDTSSSWRSMPLVKP